MKKILPLLLLTLLAVGCGGSKSTERSAEQQAQDRITILCVNDFQQMVDKGNIRVVDVRTRTEYNEGHIAGAENIDVNQPEFIERLRPKNTIAVYCRSGKRSHTAAMLIAEQGLPVYELGGGLNAWQQAGKPTVR